MQKIFLSSNILVFLFCIVSCAGKTGSTDCIDKSRISKNTICTTIYDPVCGCDNKTYGNECEAKRSGVTSFTNGECK